VLQGSWAEKRGRMSKSNEYRRVAASMAERYGVDPELYVRLIERESGFDPNARGAAGEVGLSQVMAETGIDPGYGVRPIEDRLDPVESLRFGAEYLGGLIRHYEGDVSKALMAYNGGGGNVDAGTVSSGARRYAAELLGGKQLKSGSPAPASSSSSAPASLDSKTMVRNATAFSKGLASLFGGSKLPSPRSSVPSGRFRRSGRMSPLSGVGIPGLGNIKRYSTPGGIESLKRGKS
jgi:hypothetical protein